jgi:uncharacterized protein (TIGR03435 family)
MTLLTKMAVGLVLLSPAAVLPQDAPAFDAASIKPAQAGARGYSIRPLPGRLSISNTPLRLLIASAYRVYEFQVSGGPKWLDSERYDIEAKAAGGARPTEKEMMAMLQRLLADRFALAVRRENRDLPVYALEVGRDGPKFQASKDEGEPEFRVFQRRQITARRAPLAYLLEALSVLLGRPAIDQTGLTGRYDYKLEWTPDEVQVANDENHARPADENVPSLTSALQEQLGLRLQSKRGPVEIIMVERAEKASVN